MSAIEQSPMGEIRNPLFDAVQHSALCPQTDGVYRALLRFYYLILNSGAYLRQCLARCLNDDALTHCLNVVEESIILDGVLRYAGTQLITQADYRTQAFLRVFRPRCRNPVLPVLFED
jgi:hypothetical protein